MRGPGVDLQASCQHKRSAVHLELLAGPDAGFVTVRGDVGVETITQMVPGEEPATFVERCDDDAN